MPEPNPVAVRSAASVAAEKKRHLMRTMRKGEEGMVAAGVEYLPLFRGETASSTSYIDRLARAEFYPFIEEAVGFAVGQVFGKDLVLGKDVPKPIVRWAEDIDRRGHNLHVFASDIFEDYWWNGCGLWLVDMPPRPLGADGQPIAASADDAEAEQRRPLWVRYDVQDALGWRYQFVNGRRRLSLIRLAEAAMVEDGEFGEKCEKKIRVFWAGMLDTRGRPIAGALGQASFAEWTMKKMAGDQEEWVITRQRTPLAGMVEIPLVVMGELEGQSPLREAANLNRHHWMKKADLNNIEHVANVPVPWVAGAGAKFDEKTGERVPLRWSADGLMEFDKDATCGYWEHSGACIGEAKKSLDELKGELARKAMRSLLEQRPASGDVTATSDIITAGKTYSTLQRAALLLKDSLEQGLIYTAQYAGLGDVGGSIEVNRKFMSLPRDAQSLSFVQWMVTAGLLSKEGAFATAQGRYEIVGDDLSYASEQDRIAQEGPALGTIGGDLALARRVVQLIKGGMPPDEALAAAQGEEEASATNREDEETEERPAA